MCVLCQKKKKKKRERERGLGGRLRHRCEPSRVVTAVIGSRFDRGADRASHQDLAMRRTTTPEEGGAAAAHPLRVVVVTAVDRAAGGDVEVG